ncbi:MAG: AAA family ATPase [Bryobacterales bacterium]|nr:AAA family ATPase [Bryobacterales bacterium]
MPRSDIDALSGSWKALLITPNKTIAGELSSILAQHLPKTPVFEMQSYPARQVLAELGGSQGPNLCFLDLISDAERALALIGELLAVQPGVKIIVLLAFKNPDMILRAMRQGAVEFLVRPFDPEQLDHSLERIASLQLIDSGPAKQGRVITVIPVKGACGATTIAANLAQHYKRAGHKKILLADLDPLTGTLSFQLKLRSNYSFVDALSRSTSLDEDVWKGIVTQQAGLDILLSPDQVNEGLHELRDASMIVEFARGFYEVVILDAGSVFGEWNLTLARSSDEVVLVTTNELPSLQAAQRAMDYLEGNRVNRSKIRLVVNRYNKEFGLGRDVIETALHCDVYHLLPGDYEAIHRALIEGKPVASNSNFGKSLAQLGERLCPRAKSAEQPAKKASALSGLFSSLFSKTAN